MNGAVLLVEPEHINKPDGVDPRRAAKGPKVAGASVGKFPATVSAVAVVGGDPDVVSKSEANITQKPLNFNMVSIGLCIASRRLRFGLLTDSRKIALPNDDPPALPTGGFT
ncbi:MAG: hypothetical protein CFE29_28365 [Bradyrhizobiaceae bacterium PARB1]|nr:MAG: hypothetical protein CFE29_28365 [Bradyrhizobiaceae bacterium PARB1]